MLRVKCVPSLQHPNTPSPQPLYILIPFRAILAAVMLPSVPTAVFKRGERVSELGCDADDKAVDVIAGLLEELTARMGACHWRFEL